MSWEFHDIMIRKMLYGYVATSIPSTSTNYFGDVNYTNHTNYFGDINYTNHT